ncbi:MAG: hypothetical protein HY898_18295 [Deltaproteobacteria bacterium]|nr:hypothetical protein [Deltaproteobacteria bacterium]
MKSTYLGWLLLAVGSIGMMACGGAPAYGPRGMSGAQSYKSASSPAYGGGYDQPSSAARGEASAPSDEARPGLGTGWGETRYSQTTSTSFQREDYNHPFTVASLWYNDEEGANQMARVSDYRSYDRSSYPVYGGMISVSLRDDNGRPYPSFYAGGRTYAIGEPGARYVIHVQNNSGFRFECVASVDGLDVIDGETASYSKRGYVIAPYSSLEIEGFRRSDEAVAAFRFSSVRGSYSARSGQGDRNVGVIGIALFQERGQVPRWSEDEIYRRRSADPFPQRYAQPPSN